jgi:branched-chain amino acid transport system ATP-binding protein
MSLLSLTGVRAYYGQTQALFDVSLSVDEGQVLALMGRNGMGKSTTIKAMCRMLPSTTGELLFDGQDISRLPSHVVARLGIGLVPEGRRCFRDLTVTENLIATAQPGQWDITAVGSLFPALAELGSRKAALLSGGEQQMVAIGRALMTNPRLLILDEATEGLAPMVRQQIWDAIAQLKSESGLAIVLVDKSLRELARVADATVVLERGRTAWAGRMQDLPSEVVDQYLGL